MKSAESFFRWAINTRAENVLKMYRGEMSSPEKVFLSFCSHDPAFVSYGPAGLNASIKGIGFLPKDEYLEETLEAYINHIKTFDPEDKTYSKRGLEVLVKYMYGDEARDRVDFTKVGSLEMAKWLIDRGWYIGFTGVLTFKNARKAVEVAANIPLDRLVLETDCPYMAPEPFRGKRNHPGYLYRMAEKLAEIRGLSVEEIHHITMENGKRLYGIE